jgi:hypothetical protein
MWILSCLLLILLWINCILFYFTLIIILAELAKFFRCVRMIFCFSYLWRKLKIRQGREIKKNYIFIYTRNLNIRVPLVDSWVGAGAKTCAGVRRRVGWRQAGGWGGVQRKLSLEPSQDFVRMTVESIRFSLGEWDILGEVLGLLGF